MKPRSSPVVWMLVCLIFATAVGTVQIFAQQPTSTPSLSVSIPTPTPLPNLELRVHELEMEQAQTIKSLESSNRIMTWIGGFFAVLVTFQTAVQGAATVRRWRREEQRDEADRGNIEQVSNVMDVIQRTLEGRLNAEMQARKEAEDARARLDEVREKVDTVEQFFTGFQETVKSMRRGLEDRASQWARTVSRHSFRGIASDLDDWAQEFDTFQTRFEPIEAKPRVPFGARVFYVRGIAAHCANQPKVAKQCLEKVIQAEGHEPDEIPINYNRRIANANYYLGLIESNFGNLPTALKFFGEANKLDLEERDFLTRVVTAEVYAMDGRYKEARDLISYIKTGLDQLEREQGGLQNHQLRLKSRAILVEANTMILGKSLEADWNQKAQELLDLVHKAEPQYYYATATLAQIVYEQGDYKRAQLLFKQAYGEIEHFGHLLIITEIRSRILLLMVAGMCCKYGLENERWAEEHLDSAEHLLVNLPTIGSQVCTVFSPLSKKNEDNQVIRQHIQMIRDGCVLL